MRSRYSRWDGTQTGFELGADDILDQVTDDLLYHGDLNAALRRLLQSGMRDANGERIQGVREMLEKLRRRRRDELEQHDLGGVYEDIAERLREVVNTERDGLEQMRQEAAQSGDERRQEIAEQSTADKGLQLDLLPPDLAGQVRELQNYEFASAEAQQKFDELMEELKQELLNTQFN